MAGLPFAHHTDAVNPPAAILRTILIVSTLVASWLGMQAVHELGHVIGALVSGGEIERVVLHPLSISRTDLADNPHPLIVVWAGPLLGVVLPVALWTLAAAMRIAETFLLRFFAGFCLIANGVYIGFGSLGSIGDCGEMLRHGSPVWMLWLFGVVTCPMGLAVWHGQAKHFGFGPEPHPPSPRAATLIAVSCVALILMGLLLGD